MLERIRDLKLYILELTLELESMYGLSAVRYDREQVCKTKKGDCLESTVFKVLDQREVLEKAKSEYWRLRSAVDLNSYTERQQEFIKLYYFDGLSIKQCCNIMGLKYAAVSRLKCRINSSKGLTCKVNMCYNVNMQ